MPYRIDEPKPRKTRHLSAQGAAARAEAGWSLHALAWTYHAFGRALVPSLALLVIGALFVEVPQTAEVLRNLREPGDATAPLGLQAILWFDYAHWAFNDTDVLFLFQALLTAGLLGAGAWLSMPGAPSHDLPARLRGHPELRSWGDRHVTFIVTGALVLILGAFLQAGTPAAAGGSWGRNLVGWAWAATPVAGMLVCRLVIEARGGGRHGWALGVGLLLWAGYSIGAVSAFGAGWRSSVIHLVAALLPALAYGLVSALLDVSRSVRWSLDHTDARGLQTLLLAMLVLFPVGLCVAIALAPPIIAQSYGSASLMLMQLGGLFAVAMLLSAGGRLLFHEVPGATLFAAVAVLSLLWWWTPERYGQEHLPAPRVGTEPFAPPEAWRQRVAPLDARQAAWGGASLTPHVVVHADGGGIRAAYYTAMVLARADDLTCGAFGARVFAASGVSGGSLGLAAWAVLRQELVERRAPDPATRWQACERAKAEGRTPPPLLQALIRRTLVRDHLSPVLARMVGTDAIPAYHWPAQRGQALLDSWQSAALQALTELGLEAASVTAFARPLADTTAGLDPAPWLLLNATDALTGQRVVQLNAATGLSLATAGGRIPAITAVGVATLDSARFPYVSPAGDVPSTTGAPRRLLVDGGYFDNSGAASLRDLLLAPDVAKPRGTIKIVRLDGNPSNDERTRCERLMGDAKDTRQELPAWAGLSAYFQARTAHADEAVAALGALAHRLSNSTTRYVQAQALTLRYALKPQATEAGPATAADAAAETLDVEACQASLAAVQAPLGWFMGRATAGFMQRSIEASTHELLTAAGFVTP